MPVIGTLTVNLEANTAQFTGDLGKAAHELERMAKAAKKASGDVDYSMFEARHSVMMLGEEFGVHLPRGITSFIAGLGPIGPALEAAFPFLAIALGATLLIEHLHKVNEAAEKTAAAQRALGLASTEAFNGVGDKILEVEKRIDELNGDHVAALRKELTLLDHASLKELSVEFNRLAAEADKVFGNMKAGLLESWLLGGKGGEGAKHALEEFKSEYDQLLASGDKGGAHDKLVGTLEAARKKMEEMQRSGMQARSPVDVDAQFKLISFLQTQVDLEKQITTELKDREKLAKGEEANQEAADQERIYREQQAGLRHYEDNQIRHYKELQELKKRATAEAARAEREQQEMELAVAEMFQREAEKTRAAQQKGLDDLLKDETESYKHRFAMGQMSRSQEAAAELTALNMRQAALDKSLPKELEKWREFERQKTKIINDEAEAHRRAAEMVAESEAHSLVQSIATGRSMARAFEQMGTQMLESATELVLKTILLGDMKQLKDAGHAAASQYHWVMESVPFPVNVVLAPVAAAAAFAAVQSFEVGGEVPGFGPTPIMAHGGETVVTRTLTEQVKQSARGGGQGHQFNFSPVVHALDAQGVDRVLAKHGALFEKHATSALRKLNR